MKKCHILSNVADSSNYYTALLMMVLSGICVLVSLQVLNSDLEGLQAMHVLLLGALV